MLDSDIPTEVYRYSDKSVLILRQKCADIPTQLLLTLSKLRDFWVSEYRNSPLFQHVEITIHFCRTYGKLLSKYRYVGITGRPLTQCSSQLHVGINLSSFPHTFHIGKDNKTKMYKSFSKYYKHVKQTSMLGTARMLPTGEKHDGVLHKLTKNKLAEVKRCRWFKKELLKGF